MSDEPPSYRGLQHVNVPSTDLGRSENFYCARLKLKRIARPPFGIDGIWLAAGEGRSIHITKSAEAGSSSIHHFAIEVEDLETALEYLTASGIPYRRGEYVSGAGKQAYVRDPDGNIIEFVELET